MGETQYLPKFGITLQWEKWIDWDDIVRYVSNGGIRAPAERGVYQVKFQGNQELIYIGESGSGKKNRLKDRVNFLVGRGAHNAGEKIRSNEDVSKLKVRWAITERNKDAETELLETHRVQFGNRPKYNKQ